MEMEGKDERPLDLPMRGVRSEGLGAVVGSSAIAEGGGAVSGLWEVGAIRPGEQAGEEEGGIRGNIAAWKRFVEERIAYWKFSEQVVEGTGLMGEIPYCAWKRVQFEEVLESLKEMERLLPKGRRWWAK